MKPELKTLRKDIRYFYTQLTKHRVKLTPNQFRYLTVYFCKFQAQHKSMTGEYYDRYNIT